jgi:site-specific DNA-methyltransferase (adenine-specific)
LANPDVRPNLTYPFIARNGITYLPPPNGWKYEKKRMQELDDARRLHYPAKADGRLRLKNYFDEMPGVAIQDVWTDLSLIGGTSPERLGYPTQKPLGLMERIINSSSNEGQVVLDPFCGCGTTVHAAQKLKREWIGIDVTSLAIGLIKDRIRRAFPDVEFEIVGMPKDLDGAHALADQDKYQFQWWAVQLIPDAQPYGGKKKGADSGIDGLFYFKPDLKSTEKGIISVKGGGNVSVPMIRDLAHVVKREKAQMGIFITLADPTKPMLTEAVKEGLYETVFGKYPRLQIVTIEQLLRGEIPKMPPADVSSLRRAVREDTAKQNPLF